MKKFLLEGFFLILFICFSVAGAVVINQELFMNGIISNSTPGVSIIFFVLIIIILVLCYWLKSLFVNRSLKQ